MKVMEYHRPADLASALALLARKTPLTIPLGGGTALRRLTDEPAAVVDLQDLALNQIEHSGHTINIGATVKLQALLDDPHLPAALHDAIRHEATQNQRNAATIAGTIMAADGRSPLTTVFLAIDSIVTLYYAGEEAPQHLSLGDLLPQRARPPSSSHKLGSCLITQFVFASNINLAYQYVARTPADRPIVCAAAAGWPSGRTRLALGGYGDAPRLAMDGPEPAGAEAAIPTWRRFSAR